MPESRSAQVVVFAGPSGAGKSRLAERTGLPILRLDDFYKDHDDPTLPCTDLGGGSTLVDWDDPASWRLDEALAAIESLCTTGECDVPSYDIATSSRTGHRVLRLGEATHVVAEGIFAQEVVAGCRERGLLADAFCVTQHSALTALRRLIRDLREHRKPPVVLLRRGLHLWRRHGSVVREAAARGCRVVSADEAYAAIRELRSR